MFGGKQFFVIASALLLAAVEVSAAIPSKYQVSMRIDLKGQLPIAISAPLKTGKKSSFTEIASDGKSETNVVVISKKSKVNEKSGLWMDIKVTRTVAGKIKNEERTQIFAFDNQEAEFSTGKKSRKSSPDFAVSVLAHSI